VPDIYYLNPPIFTLENRKYFDCTIEEKLSCIPIIEELISLAITARREGILALEDKAIESNETFVKYGIALIVDGTYPELVKDMLESLMIASGKCGVELLKQYIIRTGVLSVQAGENPGIVAEKLLFLLGDNMAEKVFSEEIPSNIRNLTGYTPIKESRNFDADIEALLSPIHSPVKNEPAKENEENTIDRYDEDLFEKRILIVDDAIFMRMMIKSIFAKKGCIIVGESGNGIEAAEMYEKLSPDVVILDLCMSNMNGVDAVQTIKAIDSNAKIVICSVHSQVKTVVKLLMLGACNFIVKPFQSEKLIEAVCCAMKEEKILDQDILKSIYDANLNTLSEDGVSYSGEVQSQAEIDHIIQAALADGLSDTDLHFIENLKK